MAKKIIEILDYKGLEGMIELLRGGQHVQIKIELKDQEIWEIRFLGQAILTFDCSRCGKAEYNAISSILQVMNGLGDPKKPKWTRKTINELVSL